MLSEKETLEKEKDTLNMKIDALQNSTKECLGEILEEIQISNSGNILFSFSLCQMIL